MKTFRKKRDEEKSLPIMGFSLSYDLFDSRVFNAIHVNLNPCNLMFRLKKISTFEVDLSVFLDSFLQ